MGVSNVEAEFKEFLERYCHKHKCTEEIAMTHAIVKEVYKFYTTRN